MDRQPEPGTTSTFNKFGNFRQNNDFVHSMKNFQQSQALTNMLVNINGSSVFVLDKTDASCADVADGFLNRE